MLIDDLVMS